MSSVNKAIIVGHLGGDPELRTFPSGDQVANASVATSNRWIDKQTGERREETTWHRLQFNGRLAEIAGQYLRKGSQVYVEGQIKHRKYTDSNGIERSITEIRVDQMQMLGSPDQGQGQDRGQDRGRGGGYDDRGYDDRGRGGQGYSRGGGNGDRQDYRGGQQGNYSRGGQGGQGGQGYPDNGTRGGGRGGPPQDQNQSRNGPPQDQRQADTRQQQPARQQGGGNTGFDDMDDDIPF